MNRLRNLSLKFKLILLNSFLVVFTVLLISIISIYSYNSINNRNIESLSQQIITQVSQNIDYYSTEMQNISAFANYNYYIQNFLNSSNLSPMQQYNYTGNISDLFNNISSTRTDINAIMVVSNNGQIVSNIDNNQFNPNYHFENQSWYQQAAELNSGFVMVPPHRQSYFKNSNNLVISFVQKIKSYDSTTSKGVIIIDLNLDALERICSAVHLGRDGYVIIVDRDSNVIYHPDYSYMYRSWDEMYAKDLFKEDDPLIAAGVANHDQTIQRNFDGRNLMLTSQTLPSLNWIVIGVYPLNEFNQEQASITILIIAIGLTIAGIGIIGTMFISSLIFDPINNLRKRMKRAEEGTLAVAETSGYTKDEIGALNNNFDAMMSRISELMDHIKMEERAKRKAELKFLQAQINPHFLYNTLDTIIWMAESNHKDIVPMTENLARLFRLSLSGGRDIITIREEIEHVQSYLSIQKMRYSSKMDFKIDVQEDILGLQTLKLILQPIVENAIYHGIKNMRNKGNILIKGMRVMDSVLFQVMDDGVGIESEKLKTILTSQPYSKSGVGIKNVDERIKLYYGEAYGLEINSERGIGTVVDVWLPALPYSDKQDEN
jgi:Predicted signal transduction protein with a C-terminal ATPase domain